MADDFEFTPGSGATGAADDVGGVLYPRVKLTYGPDGSADDVDVAAGKALPVQLRDTSGNEIGTSSHPVRTDPTGTTTQPVSAASLPLPSGASTSAKQDTGNTSLGNIDTNAGATSDTAVTSDTTGTLSAKLRGLVKILADMWDSTNHRLNVYLQNSSLAVTGTFWQATQPVSVADGSLTTLGSKADAKSTATDTTSISAMQVFKQISASIQAAAASLAGTLTVGTHAVTQSGTWTVQPGNTANTTPWLVTPTPATSGGPTASRIKAAASTNATSVKASAGQVYGWVLINNTAAAKYFKLYNKASSPTVGTDTPFFTIIIPASGGTNISFPMGIPMGTGVAYAITGAVGDSDTTSTAADDVHGVLLYK